MSEKVCRVGLVACGKEGAGIPEVGFVKDLRAQIERVATDFAAYRADVEPVLRAAVDYEACEEFEVSDKQMALSDAIAASRVCQRIAEADSVKRLHDAVEYVNEHHPLPRCKHGNPLRDAVENLEPPCGCRYPKDVEVKPITKELLADVLTRMKAAITEAKP